MQISTENIFVNERWGNFICSSGTAVLPWTSGEKGAAVNGISYLGINAYSPLYITKVEFQTSATSTSSYEVVTSFKIQYSDNGTNWTTVGTYEATVVASAWNSVTFVPCGCHTYWRVLANSGVSNSNHSWVINSLKMYEENVWLNKSTDKTRATASYGYEAQDAQFAFDGVLDEFHAWETNAEVTALGQWIKYDFGTPVRIDRVLYSYIATFFIVAFITNNVASFVIEAGNTDGVWTEVKAISGLPYGSDKSCNWLVIDLRDVPKANRTFRYWRIRATSDVNRGSFNSKTSWGVAEMRFLQWNKGDPYSYVNLF